MCVCVSRFALISNHAYTRVCWGAYFIDYQSFTSLLVLLMLLCICKSGIYKLFLAVNESFWLFICVYQNIAISLQRQVKITAT